MRAPDLIRGAQKNPIHGRPGFSRPCGLREKRAGQKKKKYAKVEEVRLWSQGCAAEEVKATGERGSEEEGGGNLHHKGGASVLWKQVVRCEGVGGGAQGAKVRGETGLSQSKDHNLDLRRNALG